MNIETRILAGLLCGLSLTGCHHDFERAFGADPSWGEANRQTMAAQIVDPEPDYAFDEMETSADHSSQAIERYRNDKVKQPDNVRTTRRPGDRSESD